MDEAGFLAFFERTQGSLRAWLLRVTSDDRPLVEDILQESYLRLLTSRGRTLEPEQARPYLFRIAGNLLRDHWRKQRRIEAWEEVDVEQIGQSDPADVTAAERMLRRLPPRQRALLWLAYVEGFDHREIGRMLDLKHGSVRVLLSRARHRLAELLGGDQP